MMFHSRSRCLLVWASLTVLLPGIACAAVAQHTEVPSTTKPAAARGKPKKDAAPYKGRLPNFFRTIVTEEQREKIYAIQRECDPEIRELRERIKKLTAERNAKIDALLTPEQRKEIESLRAAAKEKRRKAREERAAADPAAGR